MGSSRSSPLLTNRRGGLFVIFGPSGVGKGSVIRRLLESNPEGLFVSVSCTTRVPRAGERDGRDYRFVSDAEFDRLVRDGELLEWAEVFGSRYGTPRASIASARATGSDVVLEIDVQGARQVKEQVPDAVLILLAPPSREAYREVLRERLRARGTESQAEIERRLAQADAELAEGQRLMDHLVVNDDLERAATEVAAILGRSSPEGPPPTIEGTKNP